MSTVASTASPPFDPTHSLGSATVAPHDRVTPEEFGRIADRASVTYELVDGKLLEKSVSDYSYLVAQNLNQELILWAKPVGAGLSFMEVHFQCFPHEPERVRRPDVAFVSTARLAGYRWGQANLAVVPDLVAEVLSPREEAFEIDDKVIDYLKAGVRRVLVLNPKTRIVRIHRAIGDILELAGDEQQLTDDEVLPGFSCTLRSLFAKPGEAARAAVR